eukprot:CAMPEP_0170206842 /NCGR_PEP_ID=MMETSP0116_2-20130129/2989_1 /TAXON_ID=400756 /ORGANISM="Durinskia baltica, Strain CSIRO CS-38" /LENGTH=178 /DNA_ID=CAMNT_0010457281 /DNA_START=290 /DNA_END=826 /DNA_ORIENTATION=+
MSDDGPPKRRSMLLAALRVQCAQFPLIIGRHANPIDVVKILMLEREEVVIPIDRPPNAVVHRLVPMSVKVEQTKVEHARRAILEPPEESFVHQCRAIPPPPNAIGIKGMLYPETWVVHDWTFVLPRAKLLFLNASARLKWRLHQVRKGGKFLMHCRQDPMIDDIRRNKQEPAAPLFAD